MTPSSAASDYKVLSHSDIHFRNGKVVMVTTLSSLVALEMVSMTTSSAASDYKVVTVTSISETER